MLLRMLVSQIIPIIKDIGWNNLESLLEYYDEDGDENGLIIDSLTDSQIKDICETVANDISSYDGLWEQTNEIICEIIQNELPKYESNLTLTSANLEEEKK